MSRAIKILFLSANPKDTARLRLDEEIRAIDEALLKAKFRDKFELEQTWAVRVTDLQTCLLRHEPDIVHFSGHGSQTNAILLEDNEGNSHPVSAHALSQLFSILKGNIRCVILNACYSEQQAKAIIKHIDCVIGMSKAIRDITAISFAASFYQALAFGKDIKTAFDLGCVQIDLENIGEQDTPKLLTRYDEPIFITDERQLVSEDIKDTSYLKEIIGRYKNYEHLYTDLAVSAAPQLSTHFLDEEFAIQVLIKRSFGKDYNTIERIRIPRIQDALKQYSRIVLLGDPGCGKTVTIWRLALEYAKNVQEDFRHPYPVILELGRFNNSTSLYDWIFSQGQVIPNFKTRLNSGKVLLLFDGLNEMPRENYSENISELQKFLCEYHNCSVVLTCRRLDYDESFNLQQVEIDPLDKGKIHEFIDKYVGGKSGQNLYSLIDSESKLLDLSSNALNLKMIIAMYLNVGEQFPRNRSKLIDGFIGALYARESRKAKQLVMTENVLRTVLSAIAFNMQLEIGTGSSVGREWVIQCMKNAQITNEADLILNFAENMGILDLSRSSVRFQHQLLQEYFVALELQKRLPDKALQSRLWKIEENTYHEHTKTTEPLPPPPTTGWEEATIMLAGIEADASSLVDQIVDMNPCLAARSIFEGMAYAKPEVYKRIIKELLKLIENVDVTLSQRIHAGEVIGYLDDPRFVKIEVGQNKVLLPPLIQIPEGTYLIGSDKSEISDSYLDEIPRHSVAIKTFKIGKYPVTNKEFAYFIAAGGYKSSEYWTKEGWAWRTGKFNEELKQWLLDGYRNVRSQIFNEAERLESRINEDSEEMDLWYLMLSEWSNEKVEQELDRLFNERNCYPHEEPCYWKDPTFSGNMQPVITTWFEAQAYCCWLSKLTSKKYRLPTEAEWEAATGGSNQKLTWGNEPDTSRYNILNSRILRTNPVGIYSNGSSQFGVEELLGNLWEWTSSSKFPYPYKENDGRETPFLSDSRRVVRGGSWAVSESSARNSCRGNFPPDNLVRNYIGFRVVCEE